ncbi:MAG: mltB [Gammaproteobacteria bacterium]|nr:mltB [Gammaproteobacteria bacterium]
MTAQRLCYNFKMKPFRIITVLFLGLFLLLSACSADYETKLTDRPEVQNFIQQMVDKYQFDPKELNALFDQVRLRPQVIASMESPYEAKPWYMYKERFVSQERIDKGILFWAEHHDLLMRAEKVYGVTPSVIVAIIGVESFYGQQKGKYSVLDTLSTLAFDYPRRATYFSKELQEFLLLCREQGWEPTHVLGSYAGAVGQPQFMPSSYRAYAVDFTKNGEIDLFDNMGDIIGSVASYFHAHGWIDRGPIAVPAKITGEGYLKVLAAKGLKPTMTLAQLAHYGIHPQGKKISSKEKAILFKVEVAPNQFQYWLGFNNFYVITRYNTSILYALATAQLVDATDAARKKKITSKKKAVIPDKQ